MRLTEQQLADLKRARLRHPEFASQIDAIRAAFPGSRITYIRIEDLELGEKLLDGVIPHVPTYAPGFKQNKAPTVGEKRRSLNRYRG